MYKARLSFSDQIITTFGETGKEAVKNLIAVCVGDLPASAIRWFFDEVEHHIELERIDDECST